jgi:rhodanese-related sulfurtransferase
VIVASRRLLAIVSVSLVVSAGHALLRHVPWIPDRIAMEAEVARRDQLRATVGVTLDEFLRLIDEGAIVIDARPPSAFEQGHLAAPQTLVLNVPADEFEQHVPRLMELAGARFVLYCSSEACDSAEDVYAAMTDVGFDPADLFIYFPGWEGIVEAGLETEAG